MRIPAKTLVALALAMGLAACGSPPADKAADTSGATSVAASPAAADTGAAATTAAADGKPAAFAQCAACH